MTTETKFERSDNQINWAFMIPPQVQVASCAEGEPGTGKTETLRTLAEVTSRAFYNYELSSTTPEDLQGFPVVGKLTHNNVEQKFMQFVPDERLLRASMSPSLLLLDEVTNVIAQKQAPALNLIQNPPPGCWMFMACNPIESAADGQPLTCPFINRIWYGQWETDTEAQDWGLTHSLEYPVPNVPIVPDDYMYHQPKWGNIIADYLRYYPVDRNACPSDFNAKHKPWPSSRQWHNLSKCLAAADAVDANETVSALLAQGIVGEATAAQFNEYVKSLSLPQAKEVLANASSFQFDMRYDIALAILSGILTFLRRDGSESDIDASIELLVNLKSQNSELGCVFEASLAKSFPDPIAIYRTKILSSV